MHLTVTSVDYRTHGIAAVTVATEPSVASDGGDVVSAHLEDGEGTEPEPTLILGDTAMLHRLTRGRTLTPAEWEAIREEGRTGLAVRHAMNMVARKPRSESEIKRVLVNHEAAFDASEVEAAMARLRDLGAVDDSRWASTYVAQPRAAGRGAKLLRRELGQRGVQSADVAAALDGRDEAAEALAAALKRVRSLRGLAPDAARRRLHDFLRRRGFDDSAARRAMDTALAELLAESPTEA
ncbi:MAG: regulatory protein RecX [Dehalococcoidia bacterium]|nr:MAG: regulatory protein RecX [Dehalococcoidia bacterium]